MFSVFSMLPVRERENGVKTLQKCSGAPLWLTWLANYCWDLLNALPSLLMIIIIFASSQSIAGFATFAEKTGEYLKFSNRDYFGELPDNRTIFRLHFRPVYFVCFGSTAVYILPLICIQGKF